MGNKKMITLCGATCFYDEEAGIYFTYVNGNLIKKKSADALAEEINRLQTYVICC